MQTRRVRGMLGSHVRLPVGSEALQCLGLMCSEGSLRLVNAMMLHWKERPKMDHLVPSDVSAEELLIVRLSNQGILFVLFGLRLEMVDLCPSYRVVPVILKALLQIPEPRQIA